MPSVMRKGNLTSKKNSPYDKKEPEKFGAMRIFV